MRESTKPLTYPVYQKCSACHPPRPPKVQSNKFSRKSESGRPVKYHLSQGQQLNLAKLGLKGDKVNAQFNPSFSKIFSHVR